ncbi:hypothetical protein [Diaminobutyricimonas sp. TR449]|uniref:hypothetical protein n=1 Tax=Diaminobutyricimonas sp. TR449 TaxID=2708076 RepID=UPI00141E1EA9|nr:hypothetical protein [Diaminobutyricimonas sp. TR449]
MPWIIYAVLAVALVAALVSPLTKPDKLVDQFARTVNLAIDTGNAERITHRVIRRQRASAVATAAGSLVLFGILLLAPDVAAGRPIGMTVIATLALATAIGFGYAALTEAIDRPHDTVRVARIPSATAPDYVPGYERWGGRVAASLAGLTGLGLAAINGASGGWTTDAVLPGALGCVSLIVLAAVELTSSRVVARPQPAGTTIDLAWDDALRSSVLRDLYGAMIMGGCAVVAIELVLPAPGLPSMLTVVLPFAVVPLFLAVLVLGVVSRASRPRPHYQRRLWSEMAS